MPWVWISTGYDYGSVSKPWVHYRVQIDYAGTIDTFKWSDDGGVTWDRTLIPITTESQNLNNGVTVRFDSLTGHISGDYWDFYGGDGIFLGERLLPYYQNYGGTTHLAAHSMHFGTATQTVDQALKDEVKEWNEALRYTAYSYFRLTYNETAWKSIPDFTAIIKGRLLFDPRDDSTKFSRNPALVWLDFLTNSRYGLGVPIAMVDTDSVEDVATWCDANEYYFDGIVLDRKAFLDNFEDIMLNFKAFTVWSEGIYYLKVFTDDAAIMTLTDADIELSPESFNIKIPGITESPLRSKVTFCDKSENYSANTTIYPKEVVSQGSGTMEREASEKTLIGVNSQTLAQKIAKFGYMKRQFDKTFTVMSHPRCFVLEPGDMVQVTHEFPGWTLHKLRVNDVGYPQNGMVPLTLTDESSTIYTGDV